MIKDMVFLDKSLKSQLIYTILEWKYFICCLAFRYSKIPVTNDINFLPLHWVPSSVYFQPKDVFSFHYSFSSLISTPPKILYRSGFQQLFFQTKQPLVSLHCKGKQETVNIYLHSRPDQIRMCSWQRRNLKLIIAILCRSMKSNIDLINNVIYFLPTIKKGYTYHQRALGTKKLIRFLVHRLAKSTSIE